MAPLRTRESEDYYINLMKERGSDHACPLCAREEVIQEFTRWKIIPNKYPYDRIAQRHDMIITKRHVPESELSKEELQEFFEIKNTYINDNYEYILEPSQKKKSIPAHRHIHLIVSNEG